MKSYFLFFYFILMVSCNHKEGSFVYQTFDYGCVDVCFKTNEKFKKHQDLKKEFYVVFDLNKKNFLNNNNYWINFEYSNNQVVFYKDSLNYSYVTNNLSDFQHSDDNSEYLRKLNEDLNKILVKYEVEEIIIKNIWVPVMIERTKIIKNSTPPPPPYFLNENVSSLCFESNNYSYDLDDPDK